MTKIRPEHPNPQWERENWLNLNGEWEFEFDFSESACERKLWEKEKLDKTIIVPFCPESKLSGIGYTDFINGVCYRKKITITDEMLKNRVIIHFGAVDYESELFVNGEYAGNHKGGYTSFEFDITKFLHEGENQLFLTVSDNIRNGLQCAGKQHQKYASEGCFYTRTTGIWQTVWLEFVPKKYIKSAKFYPDTDNKMLTIMGEVTGEGKVSASAEFEGKDMGRAEAIVSGGNFFIQIPLKELYLWEIGNAKLYDLTLEFGEDSVKSYFGMRNIRISGNKFLLNNKPVFLRTVLDQGFNPDGIYTAPDDEFLKNDIIIAQNVGFNGARLHEKVFEPRFLYYCDKLGYVVWGEYPNWGINHNIPESVERYVNEWSESIERDFNHPSIVGWCPFNESWGHTEKSRSECYSLHNSDSNVNIIETIYKLTKKLDTTRPCIDVSGNFHTIPEIYDIHDYDQNFESFKQRWDNFGKYINENKAISKNHDIINGAAPFFNQPYNGEPIYISEYGGIQWIVDETDGWGYGTAPKSEAEYLERYQKLTDAILDNENIFGFCYTQLYDVEQETNGIYTYDRKPKFNTEIIRKINSRKAKIEEL